MNKPTPFYDQNGITIYHGDCAQILPFLDPVDLLLTDPPYGINASGGVGAYARGRYEDLCWDNETPKQEVIDLCISKAKSAIIWGGNFFKMSPTKCVYVWEKVQRDLSFGDAEIAWTNIADNIRVFSLCRSPALYKEQVHPTQKPLSLISWCIGRVECSSILDPFMGSGTTLVAAKNLGKRAIGIERELKYCEIAVRRLAQQTLFQIEQPNQEITGRDSGPVHSVVGQSSPAKQ